MNLRFVKRHVPAPEYGENISKPVKILQFMPENSNKWFDVPLVEEAISDE